MHFCYNVHVDSFDDQYITHLQGGLNMAYVINDSCISCGACAAECPTEAISEGDGKYVIDAEKCIECGACADVCPVDAPQP